MNVTEALSPKHPPPMEYLPALGLVPVLQWPRVGVRLAIAAASSDRR
jgi:hypothetical protein